MQEIKKWNEAAADYQKVFQNGMSEYSRSLLSFMIDKEMLYPGMRILDVGCGIGKYGTYFAAMGCDVTLTDVSPGMLEMAKRNMSAFDTPWTTLECDFQEVEAEHPAFSKGFDLGISTMCPAVCDLATVKKLSGMVDGWCFITHFVKWEEPLRQRFFEEIGLEVEEDMNRFSAHMDGLYHAVADAGYQPEITYVPYNWCDERSPQDAAEYLLKHIGNVELTKSLREKAVSAAARLCDEKGIFLDEIRTTVAWLYWKTKGE